MKTKRQLLTAVLLLNFLLISIYCFPQGAAINTTGATAHPSAMLDISSDNSGILIPRMTKSQKLLIPTPATGLMIYQTDDTIGFWYYNGNGWVQSIGATGVTGPTGADGATGSTGAVGATGLLTSGSAAGNTPYWDGNQWVVNSSNIFNNGGSVGIGTNNPDASAAIDIASTTKGTLITRMTTAERDAINTPAEGLQIFNTTTKCAEFYTKNSWDIISCPFVCGNNIIDSRDGKSYKTTQIGKQCWMKGNLKYLPSVVGLGIYSSNTPYYYVYGYDGTDVNAASLHSNYFIYGVLYNWAAAMAGSVSSSNIPSGIQGVCPVGWHLPSDGEWQELEMYIGMSLSEANSTGYRGSVGGKLKESDTYTWSSPNTSATNSSNFTALPGGNCSNGNFYDINHNGFWWSSTENNINDALSRYLYYDYSYINKYISLKSKGFSVRCIKD